MKTRGKWVWFGLVAGTATACRGCEDEEKQLPPLPPATSVAPPVITEPIEGLPLEKHVAFARARKGLTWAAPTDEELDVYGEWLGNVATAAWSDRLPFEAPPAGFEGRLVEVGRLWMLAEDPKRRRGAGLVVLRPSVAEPIVVEVPHSFFEPGTLELGLEAFDVWNAKALLVNTAHRGGFGGKADRRAKAISGKSPLDVAHNPETFFARAHETLLSVDPELVAVQLHGFGDDHAPGVQVILSASLSDGNPKALADALGSVIGRESIKTYPDEIDSLGGTTNVQARASRRAKGHFYHVEMSMSLRERFKSDAAFKRRFAETLVEGVRRTR